ncbi:hypothetical protein F4801DRAFT_111597 [Xylaria longipes]|nr:hypothetical protein F4801DRAFT_111597 [Xylaria longipes]RYC62470.1 hypothetical protein CHU98_g3761 [Xylaria longipes]
MAYLSLTARVTLVVGAIASAILLFLLCLWLYYMDSEDDLESGERCKERERRKQELERPSPEGEQQRWETVSADASTLSNPSLCWLPLSPQEVRRYQGYVINESLVMEPHTASIEYAV